MANYNSAYTGAQHDLYVTKQQLIDLIYPIGAIYISATLVNPGTLFGGTWVQIKDKFLLSAGDDHAAGAESGKEQYTADDMPAHTHTRGTMNITGSQQLPNVYGDNSWPKTSSGALSWSKASGWFDDGSNSTCNNVVIQLNAANGWTGETSQSGLNETATIMPPYLTVYMWKRTA